MQYNYADISALAMQNYNRGKYEKALSQADKALEMKGGFYLAHFIKGMCLDKLGRNEEAIEDLTKAIENNGKILNPSSLYRIRGVLYLSISRLDLAEADFRRAADLDPDSALPFYYLGLIFEHQCDVRMAVFYLERFLAMIRQDATLGMEGIEADVMIRLNSLKQKVPPKKANLRIVRKS